MPRSILILGFNLFPALSAIVFGWSAFTLILLYWIENLILGGLNELKIIICGAAGGRQGLISALSLAPFFVVHYGLFSAIHGVILFSLFDDRGATDVDLFNLVPQVAARLETDPMLFWNAVLLAVFHLLSFLIYWVAPAAWRGTDPLVQTFAPYGRIVVVHLTIMIAALPVVLLGNPLIAVVLLALVKTAMETGLAYVTDLAGGEGSLAARLAEARHGRKRPRG